MRQESPKRRTIWRRRPHYPACLTIAAGLAFSGCGGGGDGKPATQPLTKPEFIAKAKAICAEAKKETAQLSADFPGKGATPSQAQQFFEEVAPFSKRAADEIAALPAPAGDEQVEALQAAYQKGASEIAAAGESPAKAEAALKSGAGELGGCAFAPPGS
jgi:2,4-dienoyl-CoA reductase-like NADH-dependent reductase (Old Yellow Enzyme family)